jgi:hypothetical protein
MKAAQPFEPVMGRYYKVHYDAGDRSDYLYGTIEFLNDGVMVTRQKDGIRVYVPRYFKIEEVLP